MDQVVAQMVVGTAAWIDTVQKIPDEQWRSEKHPRAQLHPERPELGDVVEAGAQTFDTADEEIARGRRTLERWLVA